jgi:hypothetical protein
LRLEIAHIRAVTARLPRFQALSVAAEALGATVPEVRESEAIRGEYGGAHDAQEPEQTWPCGSVSRLSVDRDEQYPQGHSLQQREERDSKRRKRFFGLGSQKTEGPPLPFGIRDVIEDALGVDEERFHPLAEVPEARKSALH